MFEKVTHFFFYHMNYYTAILVSYFILLSEAPHFHINYSLLQLCFTVWFVYHVDIDDDLLW